MELSEAQARWFRLRRSGLVDPFPTPESAAGALAGIQAQILSAAGLSLWNRTPALTYDEFERLLYERRSLVRLWGQRGTLHIYPSEDWPLMCSALSGRSSRLERDVQREGDIEAFQATVARAGEMLRQRGTMGREALLAADLGLDEAFLTSILGEIMKKGRYAVIEGSFLRGIFYSLERLGLACHGQPEGGKGLYAHRTHWLPDLAWDPPPADQANAELARRYLGAYGPAAARDLAYWHGAKVTEARRWIAALGDEVVRVSVGGQKMLALGADLEALSETPPPREAWPVRLLYRFDPLVLGLKDKGWIVDAEHYKSVWRPAGDIEGTLLECGRIMGTWRYDRKGSGLAISLAPFAPLAARVRSAVEEIAQGVARFLGLELLDLAIADS